MIFRIIFLKETAWNRLRMHKPGPWTLVHGPIRLIKWWASVTGSMVQIRLAKGYAPVLISNVSVHRRTTMS
jgi:ABC-type Fe2+-enterobactin transport system substrate-binding protein